MEIIKISNQSQIIIIANLAHRIWHEHYTPIIGTAQVAYMVEKFQSQEAILEQIQEGYMYYLLSNEAKENIGYLGLVSREQGLFLSKFYIACEHRGKGYGKKAFEFIEAKAKELGLSKVALVVNKRNFNSIKAYEKFGLKIVAPVITDVGCGFVMDDYKMEKVLI